MDGLLLENGVDKFLLEDGSGVLLLEQQGASGGPDDWPLFQSSGFQNWRF